MIARWLSTKAALALVGTLLLCACDSGKINGDAIEGTVLEYGTGKPLAGAVVWVHWSGKFEVPLKYAFGAHGGGAPRCFHEVAALTDAAGKFYIPKWERTMQDMGAQYQPFYESGRDYGSAQAYFPGYRTRGVLLARATDGGPTMNQLLRGTYVQREAITLEPDPSPPDVRLKWLGLTRGSCEDVERSKHPSMRALYRAAHDEAQLLATSAADIELVNRLAEYGQWFGDAEQERIYLARKREREILQLTPRVVLKAKVPPVPKAALRDSRSRESTPERTTE